MMGHGRIPARLVVELVIWLDSVVDGCDVGTGRSDLDGAHVGRIDVVIERSPDHDVAVAEWKRPTQQGLFGAQKMILQVEVKL